MVRIHNVFFQFREFSDLFACWECADAFMLAWKIILFLSNDLLVIVISFERGLNRFNMRSSTGPDPSNKSIGIYFLFMVLGNTVCWEGVRGSRECCGRDKVSVVCESPRAPKRNKRMTACLCPLWARSKGDLAKLEGCESKTLSCLFFPKPLDC